MSSREGMGRLLAVSCLMLLSLSASSAARVLHDGVGDFGGGGGGGGFGEVSTPWYQGGWSFGSGFGFGKGGGGGGGGGSVYGRPGPAFRAPGFDFSNGSNFGSGSGSGSGSGFGFGYGRSFPRYNSHGDGGRA